MATSQSEHLITTNPVVMPSSATVAAAAAAAVGATLAYFISRHRLKSRGDTPARIVLFGDSITQQSWSVGGWGARLQERYQRRADVLNRGYSGYNTRWALEVLNDPTFYDGSDSHVILATIFFGANDASLPQHNMRQHVPLEEYAANLRSIVRHFRQHCPRAALVLIAPPPVCHEQRLAFQRERYPHAPSGVLERTNEAAGEYAAAAARVAVEMGIACVNLWAEMQRAAPAAGWHAFLSDGLHLSEEGNRFVDEALWRTLRLAHPELVVEADPRTGSWGNSATHSDGLQPAAPWHDQIDHTDHLAAFSRAHKRSGGAAHTP